MSDLISRADAIDAKPEYRNEDMWDKEKSTYNKGWNDCNDAWVAIIKALPSADADVCEDYEHATLVDIKEPLVKHDREWIIGCIEHDGFIHTHRFDKANQIILEALQTDKISRAELFNRLAAVHAPMEANEYKAEVYRIINEM